MPRNYALDDKLIDEALKTNGGWQHEANDMEKDAFRLALASKTSVFHALDVRIYWSWFHMGWKAASTYRDVINSTGAN